MHIKNIIFVEYLFIFFTKTVFYSAECIIMKSALPTDPNITHMLHVITGPGIA
jgi:hypothetical protein